MTDRALFDDVPVEPDQSLHLVIDLTDNAGSERPDGVPWLSEQARLLNAHPASMKIRRMVDVLGAATSLIVLAPLLGLVALLIKATSRGPVLYKQRRVGRHGTEFDMLKFRSMCEGADQKRSELKELNEATGPVFKIRDDPRITPVGHLIRRASIDELPQLWNVLKGDMSLVGPRPPLPDEVATYGEWERQRLVVTPGVTCIWQVSGRSDLDFETWVSMDIHYIEHWSLWLDLKLIVRTIPAVLSGEGAY